MKNIIKIVGLVVIALFIFTGCDGKKSKENAESTTNAIDVCKCLTEPGDSKYMIDNKDACRDAISKEIGVENWETINMATNPGVSARFDALAARCK